MPRYAALLYSVEVDNVSPEDWSKTMEEYNEFGAKAADVIKGGEALEDSKTATTVSVTGGKGGQALHTDGPFAETKEVLGGFYLLDCANLDEALSWAAQIPAAWNGRVEVRPCIDFSGEGQ